MFKQVGSRIIEVISMWSIRGWIRASSYESYGDEIFDVHVLSNFLKFKLIGVPFKRYVLLKYLSPLIIVKHFYF